MIIGFFTGITFITFLYLVVWSVIREKERNRAFKFSLSLVACWSFVLYFGVVHPLGNIAAVVGIVLSGWALLAPFQKRSKNKIITKDILDDLELAYVSEYRLWEDPTQGPLSGIGTMNDYNRMLMGVLWRIEEKYPDIDINEDILTKLKDNGPMFYNETIDVPSPLKMICEQISHDIKTNNGSPSKTAKEEGYIIHYSPAGGLIASGYPVPDSDEFDVILNPYESGSFHLTLNEKEVSDIALGEKEQLTVRRCTFKKCSKKFYRKRLVCENCRYDPA